MCYDALEVARHIISYSEKDFGISNLKLQKVLYFVQAYFLMKKGIPCFKDKIEAWDFGPVVPKVYMEFKGYGGGSIPFMGSYLVFNESNPWDAKREPFLDIVISKKDKKLIDKVVERLADYTSTNLVSLTQRQSPWIEAFVPGKNNEIKNEAIAKYFAS